MVNIGKKWFLGKENLQEIKTAAPKKTPPTFAVLAPMQREAEKKRERLQRPPRKVIPRCHDFLFLRRLTC
jgi:hypothetical protein